MTVAKVRGREMSRVNLTRWQAIGEPTPWDWGPPEPWWWVLGEAVRVAFGVRRD